MSAHVFVFIDMILILPEKYIVHVSSKRRHTKVVVESGGIGENAGSGSCGVNSSNWRYNYYSRTTACKRHLARARPRGAFWSRRISTSPSEGHFVPSAWFVRPSECGVQS